ncbi:GNAT family N-acetyltransferase [Spirochaeta cellobiosiphila]|uniref:GNAT family N-acetyltransferase n=1 Tax=Spirochaeta cellobiosiphila TaxID=504483 RepID=UPI000416A906|nr:GNAT family protein [Spirochaeta cellobiosiphila]
MKTYYIRDIQESDLKLYRELIQPDKEYHKFNGPYYKNKTEEEIDVYIQEIRNNLSENKLPQKFKKQIVDSTNENLVGEVNWYWKSEETNWLEVGIVIFNDKYWGKGIGSIILPEWINQVFDMFPEIIRIGLTTWSGNLRMMKLAEKLGLIKEAEFKKARIVDNNYYDSISYGILKENWLQIKEPTVSTPL